MTDDIDIVAAALSGDKKAVLKEQLTRIDREILERVMIELLTRASIEDDVRDLREQLLQLQPAHQGVPDDPVQRRDRLALKKEELDLTKELREERRECWNDVQALKREERDVQKELSTTERRDKRLHEFDDP